MIAGIPRPSSYLIENRSLNRSRMQRGEKAVARRGHPFVQLVTEHKRKVGNLAMRVFLTTPLPGSAYADPERLLESSGTYGGQAHVTVRLGSNLGQVMALVEQSYRFKVIKSE